MMRNSLLERTKGEGKPKEFFGPNVKSQTKEEDYKSN